MTRKIVGILFVLVALYLALVGALYMAQRSMVFVPDRNRPDPVAGGVPDMTVVEVKTQDGLTLRGWFSPPPEDSTKPVLVYFHGNAGNIESRGPVARQWIDDGYGVLLSEYRGYGGNPGHPSEEGFYEDARAWLRWLSERGLSDDRWILYGESLGSGVATQMALEYPGVKVLVLQSGYTSLPDVARKTYFFVPVDLLMKDHFENLRKIPQVKAPILILHGARDSTIPVDHAQRLYAAAPDPRKMEIFQDRDHSDIPAASCKAAVEGFLSSLPAR